MASHRRSRRPNERAFIDWLVETGQGRTVLAIVCAVGVGLALEALVIE